MTLKKRYISDIWNIYDSTTVELPGGLLKNKKMIERRVIEKEEDGRLRDYTQYRIQPDVYEVLKPSYDQFYSIIGD